VAEAQGQGIGWKMMSELIDKLKKKAEKDRRPILFDMHLREGSQRFMDTHNADFERMDVKMIEEALVSEYFENGEDSLYRVYEVRAD